VAIKLAGAFRLACGEEGKGEREDRRKLWGEIEGTVLSGRLWTKKGGKRDGI